MGAFLGQLGRAVYGISLAINMLWTAALMNVVNFLPMPQAWVEGVNLVLVQLAWRIAHIFSPWVNCQADEDYAEQWSLVLSLMAESDAESAKEGKTPPPLFILANHSSFLDTVLGAAKLPIQAIWRCRTYMASHLYKLPVLCTICKSVGHFPVYFASGEDGVFKVDAQRMEAVELKVDGHLRKGGWLSFFPEGQMNPDPSKIMPLRYGGMKKALQYDARLVTMVFSGCPEVWPRKAQLGGFPGKVRYSIRTVAMDGAKAFVEMARAEGVKEEKDLQDHEILARRLQELMQAQYDGLKDDSQNRGLNGLADRLAASSKDKKKAK